MFFCCDMTAASMASFMPTILTELGWVSARAQVMSIPIWITGAAFQISMSWVSGRIGWRSPFILFGTSVAAIGWIIMVVYVKAPGIRYFALFCMSAGTFIQMGILTSWMTNNLRGRASIAVGTAIIFGLGNCANFVAANVFIVTEKPRYPTGYRTGLGITLVGATLCWVYIGLIYLHNRKVAKKIRNGENLDDQKDYRYLY